MTASPLPDAITDAIDRLEDTAADRAIASSNSNYVPSVVRPNQEARAALEAAIAALLPGGVNVKPLVWHRSVLNGWNDDWHTMPTFYTIRCADENGWKWAAAGAFGYAPSPDLAKAAAQADYSARILAALLPPVPA